MRVTIFDLRNAGIVVCMLWEWALFRPLFFSTRSKKDRGRHLRLHYIVFTKVVCTPRLFVQVLERPVEVEELLAADEVFCTGTAVVVNPVGSITHDTKRYTATSWTNAITQGVVLLVSLGCNGYCTWCSDYFDARKLSRFAE